MKKTKITIREIPTIEIYCDVCGKKVNRFDYTNHNCLLCNKDLCRKCLVEIPEEYDNSGDYTRYGCRSCYDISRPFFKEIEEIETKAEKKCSVIRAKMLDVINSEK